MNLASLLAVSLVSWSVAMKGYRLAALKVELMVVITVEWKVAKLVDASVLLLVETKEFL